MILIFTFCFLQEIREILERESPMPGDSPSDSDHPVIIKNQRRKVQVGKVINLFGGVEVSKKTICKLYILSVWFYRIFKGFSYLSFPNLYVLDINC
jgi:hypothetical protein